MTKPQMIAFDVADDRVVGHLYRPPGHDGQCAAQVAVQGSEGGDQPGRDAHRFGARRQLSERAVEIKKKCVGSCQDREQLHGSGPYQMHPRHRGRQPIRRQVSIGNFPNSVRLGGAGQVARRRRALEMAAARRHLTAALSIPPRLP